MATTSGSRTGDFCSVVVAGGYGINLLPLTVSDPKYLLSVGNYPLIYYSLRSLEDAGFCDTLLVTRGQWLQEIQEAVENLKMKIKCEYLVLPDQYESNTASVLFWIKPKLKCEDILVLSGDVYGDVEIKAMAATYRKRNASLCMYAQRHPEDMGYDLLECGVHPSSITKIPDDPNNICEYLAFDPKDDKLLLCEYDTDISETISIPRRLYRKHPDFKICHKVLDLHLYMLKRSVVNLITPQSLLDYKSDLVCYLLNKQFLEENKPVPPQLFENEEDTPFTPDSKYTCVQNADLYPSDELIRCFVHFSTGQSLCLRVNNAPVLYISNMMELKNIGDKSNPKSLEPVNMKETKDILVGTKTTFARDLLYKHTVIGKSCTIGNNCNIINSVILNNVTIEDGCEIVNSIIGNDSTIGTDSRIEECVVGTKEILQPSTNLTKKTIPSTQSDVN